MSYSSIDHKSCTDDKRSAASIRSGRYAAVSSAVIRSRNQCGKASKHIRVQRGPASRHPSVSHQRARNSVRCGRRHVIRPMQLPVLRSNVTSYLCLVRCPHIFVLWIWPRSARGFLLALSCIQRPLLLFFVLYCKKKCRLVLTKHQHPG